MKTIYFDNSATTPLCPAAREALLRVLDTVPGNPSSLHALGAEAERELTEARAVILTALGSDKTRGRLVFTGCGSEANNLAILGAARAKKFRGTPRLITTDSEHPSVLRQAELLASSGWDVVRISTRGGVLDREAFGAALTPETAIVSLMLVNNETGALYDAASAFALVRRRVPSAILHCDAVQAFLKVPFSVHRLGCDALSVSAHKVGAPKGVGALWYSPELERRRALSPVIYGGGQEAGLRSGTENVAGIAAFAAAVRENAGKLPFFTERTTALSAQILETLTAADAGIRFNLPPVRAPHILSITNPRVRSETLVHFLSARQICVSAGSACSSHDKKPESALPAFGLTEKETRRTLRVSLSADNTPEEAAVFCSALLEGVKTLAGEA